MMTRLFVPTHAHPPRVPPHHLPRRELAAKICQALALHDIVVIQAPAGYGKSVLLTEIMDCAEMPTVYLNFQPLLVEPAALLQSHIAQIADEYPVAALRATEVFAGSRSIELAYRALVSDIERETGPLLLLLDNCPPDGEEGPTPYLRRFLESLPRSWRVVLNTNTQPDLPLVRWAAEGRMASFSQADLALKQDEVVELASAILGYRVSQGLGELLMKTYDGWVLGVVLGCRAFSYEPADTFERFLREETGLTASLRDYFENEAGHAHLDDDTRREFAYRTSVLSELAVDICNELMGITNAGELLLDMERRGLFIARLDQIGSIYRYMPTYARYLQVMLYQAHGISGAREIHAAAARIHRDRSLWRPSIRHYLAAGAYDEAADVLEAHGNDLLERSSLISRIAWLRSERVEEPVIAMQEFLDALPADTIEERPALLFLKGRVYYERNEVEQARLFFDEAVKRIGAAGQTTAESSSAVRWAFAAQVLDRHTDAQNRLQALLAENDTAAPAKAEALLSLSSSLYAVGERQAALDAGEEALRIAAGLSPRAVALNLQMRTAQHLVYIAFDLGDLRRARELAQQAYTISVDEKFGGAYRHGEMIRAYLQVCVALGDFSTTNDLFAEWEWLNHAVSFDCAVRDDVTLLRAWAAYVQQDYVEAERSLASAGRREGAFVLLRLAQRKAREAARSVEDWIASLGETPDARVFMTAETIRGIVQAQMGDIAGARERLERTTQYFKEVGQQYLRAGAELHLAWLLRRSGQRERAHAVLASALDYAEEQGCMSLAFWTPEVAASSCAEALHINLHPTYMKRLLERLAPTPPPNEEQVAMADAFGTEGELHRAMFEYGLLTPQGHARLADTYGLSAREIEVFLLYIDPRIRSGMQPVNDAIAARLVISKATVRNHISRILNKLNAAGRDRLQLRTWAIHEGIIVGKELN